MKLNFICCPFDEILLVILIILALFKIPFARRWLNRLKEWRKRN